MSNLNDPGYVQAGPDPLSTKTHEAPPQHPSLGNSGAGVASKTTTADIGGGANTTTTGGAAVGQGIGDKLKAGWNLFHGAGEELRGTFNNTADQVGDQIAGRGGTGAAPATRTGAGEHPAQVAASGEDEMRAGLEGLKR